MQGYAFEVAIAEDDTIKGGWHSLCRRHVALYRITDITRNLREKLIECDEDGFVGTSVTTSAPPITGEITAVTSAADYLVTLKANGALGGPSTATSGDYVVTTKGERPTQFRSIFRDNAVIDDLLANQLHGGHQQDRAHLTVDTGQEGAPPTTASLFLSPIFTTEADALKDPEMPQSGVQFFNATNEMRGETYVVAFNGGVTAFLDYQGQPSQQWPTNFGKFEAEGERRLYIKAPYDVVAEAQAVRVADINQVSGVFSDSLPQAALTPEMAKAIPNNLKIVTLPFATSFPASARPGSQTKLQVQEQGAGSFPWLFKFAGKVDTATILGDGRTYSIMLQGLSFELGAAGNPTPLRCDANKIFDRNGGGVPPSALSKDTVVSGQGRIDGPAGPFTLTWLNVLGTTASASPDVAAILRDPYAQWLPRWFRIDADLLPVRGAVNRNIGFNCRGGRFPTFRRPLMHLRSRNRHPILVQSRRGGTSAANPRAFGSSTERFKELGRFRHRPSSECRISTALRPTYSSLSSGTCLQMFQRQGQDRPTRTLAMKQRRPALRRRSTGWLQSVRAIKAMSK